MQLDLIANRNLLKKASDAVPLPGIIRRGRNAEALVRLFCFPFAGSGASTFMPWAQLLPKQIEVCPIQLPGREELVNIAPVKKMSQLASIVAAAILPYADKPFAFFGHSMGALLAFEVARLLRKSDSREPFLFISSAASSPQTRSSPSVNFDLPAPDLIEELRQLGGSPKEALEHQELMDILLPAIRADLEALETYVYEHDRPLVCPILAIGGLEDHGVLIHELDAWADQTVNSFSKIMLAGGHFFINDLRSQLIAIVVAQIRQYSDSFGVVTPVLNN